MRTKTFEQIHDQESRLNAYAPTGYRWQRIWQIAYRYKEAYFKRFGLAVCSDPELWTKPLTRMEYAGY